MTPTEYEIRRLEAALNTLENRIEMYRAHVSWPALIQSLQNEADAIRAMLLTVQEDLK